MVRVGPVRDARPRLRHDDARVHLHLVHESRADVLHNVQELAVKVSFDDSSKLGKARSSRTRLSRSSLATAVPTAVHKKGTYVELGIAPGLFSGQSVDRVPDQGRPEREGLLRIRTVRTASSATSAWPASSLFRSTRTGTCTAAASCRCSATSSGRLTASAIRSIVATPQSRPSVSASRIRIASSPGRGTMSRLMNVTRVAAALGAAAALLCGDAGIGAEYGPEPWRDDVDGEASTSSTPTCSAVSLRMRAA